eukprot:scaffold2693_cov139-Isochrysis_galbana.AAC.1
MTDPPIDDTVAREQDAPGTHDAKRQAPVHGHTGDVPSHKALSDIAPPFSFVPLCPSHSKKQNSAHAVDQTMAPRQLFSQPMEDENDPEPGSKRVRPSSADQGSMQITESNGVATTKPSPSL